MSISNEINRLEQAKQDIKDAMQAKGITVPSDATIDEYAELLASMVVDIAFGGTGATTASQARTNLGITPANIGAAATSHSHSNASTSAAGFLPKLGGGTTNYLRADGTWAKPPDTNTTYGVATSSTNGLMSATDKKKLDTLEETSAISTSFIESLL